MNTKFVDEFNHNFDLCLDSRQGDLLSLNVQNDWLNNYLENSKSIRGIHRWNFLQPFTDASFSIEPLNSSFNRYLEYLHYCRFHNTHPVVHLDSDLLWMLWSCQKNAGQFPEISRSALQLFCELSQTEPKISFFEDNELILKLNGSTYSLVLEQSEDVNRIKIHNQNEVLNIFLDRNLLNYRKALRERYKKNLNFTPALIPHSEDSEWVRSLYNLPKGLDCEFNEQKVATYLNIDLKKLSRIQKKLIENLKRETYI